jgi:hypothetical protein
MLASKFFSTLFVVVSMTSGAFAQLKPGQGSGGSGGNQNQPNPPRYNPPGNQPRPGQGGGGGHERPGNGGYDRPGQGGGHERPGNGGHQRPPDYPDYGRPDHGRPDYARPRYPNYPPYNPPPQYPDYPPQYPDYPPAYDQQEVRSAWIGRSVRNERLPIGQLAGLEYYQGWELVGIRASVRPNSNSTTVVRLLVDGRIMASQTNPGYEIGLYPQTRIILGAARGVQLEVIGSTEMQNVEVMLVRRQGGGGGGYYPPPVDNGGQLAIPLNRTVYGNDQIDLNPFVDFYRYNGYRIIQIIVRARTSYGTGLIDFLINGFNMGTMQFRDGGYSSQDSLNIGQRPVIGRDASSLVLYTRGNMVVDQAILVLSR